MNVHEVNSLIEKEFDKLKHKVIQKNFDYNNSLQTPLGIFYKGGKTAGILARIDDKLNRIVCKGLDDKTEDTIDDLIGYLVHYKISKKLEPK